MGMLRIKERHLPDMMKRHTIALAALLTLVCAWQADAAIFAEANGSLAASASFAIDGDGRLIVTLTNTSGADVVKPVDVLTGVFFNIDGNPTLTPLTATVGAGSTVLFGSAPGGDVSGEWAYALGLSAGSHPGTQGISSTGLGLFGSADLFDPADGTNLDGPDAPNGLNYGIVSAGDDPEVGNKPVTGGNKNNPVPLIKNSVVFALDLPEGVDIDPVADIFDVTFQYGTDLSETSTNGVIPEPSTMVIWSLLGTFGLGLGTWRRRRTAR